MPKVAGITTTSHEPMDWACRPQEINPRLLHGGQYLLREDIRAKLVPQVFSVCLLIPLTSPVLIVRIVPGGSLPEILEPGM